MYIFQAGLLVLEGFFKVEAEEEEPEPLRLEHFYFPLGLWLVGLLLSSIFLLAEIIIHRRRKSQSEVAMLRLEEPSVTKTEGGEVDLAVSEHIENIEVTKV